MTDIEQKALALVNEVGDPKGFAPYIGLPKSDITNALCRAIEQHEAFRQEVSDAVEHFKRCYPNYKHASLFDRFIIAKPDPLVEVLLEMELSSDLEEGHHDAKWIRSKLEARGLEIREKNDVAG